MSSCGHDHSHHGHHADKWTTVASVGEFISSFISNGYWLGGLLDIACGFAEDFFGLSKYGFGFGACVALFAAAGSAYCHRALNVHHQLDTEHRIGEVQLLNTDAGGSNHQGRPWLVNLALAMDYLSHIGEFSGPIVFVIDLGTKRSFSAPLRCGVHFGITLLGAIPSYANVRTCSRVTSHTPS